MAAADRHLGAGFERGEEIGYAFRGMREVGVHHHQPVVAGAPDAVQDGEREVAGETGEDLDAHEFHGALKVGRARGAAVEPGAAAARLAQRSDRHAKSP